MTPTWTGIYPAITTPFDSQGDVDYDFLAEHAKWLMANGCHGIVVCGSLGEGATLTLGEREGICEVVSRAIGDAPTICGIAALSTDAAITQAKVAESAGCSGLMVLPAYSYSTDWREAKAHVVSVMRSTSLSCMLYNNPISYKTDYTPENIAELAGELENFHAVKESSADVRRLAAIRALIGNRLMLMVGVDDLIVEALRAGADGWIAGLVNAFPRESAAIYHWTHQGRHREVDELYQWFLPLLRLDVVPKLVQLIKLAQAEVGMGSPVVRAPRLELEEKELEEALAIIRRGLDTRPAVDLP
ncbi:MAG: dihydrodipicolinate synthase family protein [Fimbriimonas sp.]